MSDLITIERREVSGATVQTCNARDLWQFVESKQQFADWIKGRIERYGLVVGEDYVVHKFVDNPAGGRPTLDDHYAIAERDAQRYAETKAARETEGETA